MGLVYAEEVYMDSSGRLVLASARGEVLQPYVLGDDWVSSDARFNNLALVTQFQGYPEKVASPETCRPEDVWGVIAIAGLMEKVRRIQPLMSRVSPRENLRTHTQLPVWRTELCCLSRDDFDGRNTVTCCSHHSSRSHKLNSHLRNVY